MKKKVEDDRKQKREDIKKQAKLREIKKSIFKKKKPHQ